MKHPLTAITDKHGFSKVWGSKLGEHVTPLIDGRVQHFLAHSEVDHGFCRESQNNDAITSMSGRELRQCPSSLIQTARQQRSLKVLPLTQATPNHPEVQKENLITKRLLHTSPCTQILPVLAQYPDRPMKEAPRWDPSAPPPPYPHHRSLKPEIAQVGSLKKMSGPRLKWKKMEVMQAPVEVVTPKETSGAMLHKIKQEPTADLNPVQDQSQRT